jgi:hypothetical protein
MCYITFHGLNAILSHLDVKMKVHYSVCKVIVKSFTMNEITTPKEYVPETPKRNHNVDGQKDNIRHLLQELVTIM